MLLQSALSGILSGSRDLSLSDTGTPEKRLQSKRGGDSSPSSPASHASRMSGRRDSDVFRFLGQVGRDSDVFRFSCQVGRIHMFSGFMSGRQKFKCWPVLCRFDESSSRLA